MNDFKGIVIIISNRQGKLQNVVVEKIIYVTYNVN
jgi:hypothetical protein